MPRFRKQFDNNLSGVLFENDRRSKDGDPDLKGQCEVDGIEYWVAGWWNQHPAKGDYLKFKLTPKESDDRSPQQRNNDYQRGADSRGGGQRSGSRMGGQSGRGGYGDDRQAGNGRASTGQGGRNADEFDDDISF